MTDAEGGKGPTMSYWREFNLLESMAKKNQKNQEEVFI